MLIIFYWVQTSSQNKKRRIRIREAVPTVKVNFTHVTELFRKCLLVFAMCCLQRAQHNILRVISVFFRPPTRRSKDLDNTAMDADVARALCFCCEIRPPLDTGGLPRSQSSPNRPVLR